MLCRRGDDVQAEGPNPLSSVRVRPAYPGYTLAGNRRPTHHANITILGFRLTPLRSLAFRRPAARFRLTPACSLAFRRPAARFRLTTHVAMAKTAVAPLPSPFAAS